MTNSTSENNPLPQPGAAAASNASLLQRYRDHAAHPSVDSLWGRCTTCGLTWTGENRARTILDGPPPPQQEK